MTTTENSAMAAESATLDAVSTTSATPKGSLYGRLWRTVPQELGFLLASLPIVIFATVILWVGISLGIGLLLTFIGIFIVIATLYVARGFGTFELIRLRGAGRPVIKRPNWNPYRVSGFWANIFGTVLNPHYWLYLVHALLVNIVVGAVTWAVSFAWVVTALSGITYWIYSRWIPTGDNGWTLYDWVKRTFFPAWNMDPQTADALLYFLIGAIFLATLPFVTRGLTMVHYGIALGMLGRFRVAELQGEVAGLSASRTAAVSAEGTSLRRLERDIHDGPQQRLVRMQMDLASADRQLADDPEKARTLIAEAMEQSREALEELRALSRGFAPPILLDRGLVAAIESLSDRSTIPVRIVNLLAPGADLPQEIERNAYFVAAEMLTNVAKHSGANDIELRLELRRIPEPDATWLDVVVADNGIGGAIAQPGHGIAGLEERLRGLGGTLEISSPAGGPTVISAHLPVTY
ncbi:sensor domain-containing protein [Glaciihabitans sp. UYNi722]|uniref:sensor histidine kinase n=1 Tax=Glaciihabitans sp. UYNi722 TaxID=3156344 RepID=UPI00339AEF6C